MDDLRQIFDAEITLFPNQKISVTDQGFPYYLRFGLPDDSYAEVDCRIVIDGQSTLSSNRPRKAVIKTYQSVEDIDFVIATKDRFTIYGEDYKIGNGIITDIVFQS